MPCRFLSGGPEAEDSAWKHWEWGDESFATRESGNAVNKNVVPVKGGKVAFTEASAVLRSFVSESRQSKIERVIAERSGTVRFAIEDPTNLSNAWACLRTLDSFGIQYVDVILNERLQAKDRSKSMYTAMGSQKWLDIQRHTSTETCVAGLKARGWTICATDLSEGAVSVDDMPWDQLGPVAIVLGNEERGISPLMRSMADHRFYLPMRGFAQSFSLSVGCAALVSRLDALSPVSGLRPGSLSDVEKDRILFQWFLRSVKGGPQILRRYGFDIADTP